MGVDRVLSFADALWPSFLTARGTAPRRRRDDRPPI